MLRGPAHKQKKKRIQERKELHLFRAKAELKIDATGQILSCRVFLNDLSPTGVGLFINQQLVKGDKVTVVIEHPKKIFLKGEVAWCTPSSLDIKVLTSETYRYRIGVRFLFDTEEEQSAVRKYCEALFQSQQGEPRKKAHGA